MSVVKSKCLVVTAPPPHCLFELSPADLRDPKGGHTSRNGWWIPGIQICNCSWNIHLKYDSLFHTSPLNYKLLFFCKYNLQNLCPTYQYRCVHIFVWTAQSDSLSSIFSVNDNKQVLKGGRRCSQAQMLAETCMDDFQKGVCCWFVCWVCRTA